MEALIAEVLERIDQAREDLAELALRLGNTYGPLGNEEPTAVAVHEWYRENGMESHLVPMIEGRAGTVGRLRGSGGGKSLIFNAHLDTEASGPDYDRLMEAPDPNRVGARREGDRIFGHTVQNDRGCMAVQMVAGRALRDAGAPLRGDLLLKSAAGETGSAPVDEYQGLRYESKGFGTNWLLEHGYTADYAVIAETTDFSASWVQCGAAYFKVTLRGRNMYTPSPGATGRTGRPSQCDSAGGSADRGPGGVGHRVRAIPDGGDTLRDHAPQVADRGDQGRDPLAAQPVLDLRRSVPGCADPTGRRHQGDNGFPAEGHLRHRVGGGPAADNVQARLRGHRLRNRASDRRHRRFPSACAGSGDA